MDKVDDSAAADLPRQQMGLFLDVDGTLLDLAPSPSAVEVPPELPGLLAAVEQRLGGALALLSGRPIAELDRLFAPVRLRASGVHGAEIRQSGRVAGTRLLEVPLPDIAWKRLLRLLRGFPESFAENKATGFAVHHRLAGDRQESLAAALDGFIAEFAEFRLVLHRGRCVFEIARSGCSKGRAIELFMMERPFIGRVPVFVADDRIDRPGFEMALALGGRAYSVGAALPGLSGWFAGPAAVRAWIGRLAR